MAVKYYLQSQRNKANWIITSRDTQEESSTGNSSIKFRDKSTFVIPLDSHIFAGTALKDSPPKDSSWFFYFKDW